MPDKELAEAAGGFEWGVPIAGIPSFRTTVPRLALLEQLDGIAGQTLGQMDARPHWQFWSDKQDTENLPCGGLLPHRAQRVQQHPFGRFTRPDIPRCACSVNYPGPDLGAARRGGRCIGGFPGGSCGPPWSMVVSFDNAPNMLALQKYMPTMGNGSVIITTTNSTGDWFPRSQRLQIGGVLGGRSNPVLRQLCRPGPRLQPQTQ